MAESFAKKGWDFALKQEQKSSHSKESAPKGTTMEGVNTRSYSTVAARHPPLRHHGNSSHGARRCYSTSVASEKVPLALVTRDIEGFPPRLKALRARLVEFMAEEVYPAETVLADHQLSRDRWKPHPRMETLKVSWISLNVVSLVISSIPLHHQYCCMVVFSPNHSYSSNRKLS